MLFQLWMKEICVTEARIIENFIDTLLLSRVMIKFMIVHIVFPCVQFNWLRFPS